jgi:SMODS and SLOG-associating 2TM effector domain 3/SMODS and SLOG-associating 2TM effector domain 1
LPTNIPADERRHKKGMTDSKLSAQAAGQVSSNDIEYPALLDAADGAAASGQRWYFRLVKADLGLIVIGALSGGLSPLAPTGWTRVPAIVSAVTIGTGAVMRWANRTRKPNKAWFDGRAVAESVKTTSWRYMMRIDPFDAENGDSDRRFIADLREILLAGRDLQLIAAKANARQITESMLRVRSQPFETRRQVYLEMRIKEQIEWYSSRASFHRRRAQIFFVVGLGAELIALALAIVIAAVPGTLNLIGFFASLAAAATAFAQLQSHDELGRSYAVAAAELSLIQTLIERCDESDFAESIKDAEGAISREHTMWIAKRS